MLHCMLLCTEVDAVVQRRRFRALRPAARLQGQPLRRRPSEHASEVSLGTKSMNHHHRSGRGWAAATWRGCDGYFAFARGTGNGHHLGGGHSPSFGRRRNTHHPPPSRCRPASSGAVVVVIFLLPIVDRELPYIRVEGMPGPGAGYTQVLGGSTTRALVQVHLRSGQGP